MAKVAEILGLVTNIEFVRGPENMKGSNGRPTQPLRVTIQSKDVDTVIIVPNDGNRPRPGQHLKVIIEDYGEKSASYPGEFSDDREPEGSPSRGDWQGRRDSGR